MADLDISNRLVAVAKSLAEAELDLRDIAVALRGGTSDHDKWARAIAAALNEQRGRVYDLEAAL